MLILALCIAILNVNAIYAQSNDTEIQDIESDIETMDNTSELLNETTADYSTKSETETTEQQYAAAGENKTANNSSQPASGAIYVRADTMKNVDFNQLKVAGITDIFLSFAAFDTPSYNNTLNKFLNDSHNNGIRVSVWVQAFRVNNKWINPTLPENKAIIDGILNDIQRYTQIPGVGGIHLDYVRFPGNAYNSTNGTESITNYVATVNQLVKALNPNALLSAALMPEGPVNAYYYGQDYAQLANHLDVLVPMIYRGNFNQTIDWVGTVTSYIVNQAGGTQVWAALLSYHSDANITAVPANVLMADLIEALDKGASGYAIFRFGILDNSFYNAVGGITEDDIKPPSFSLEEITNAASRVKKFIDNKMQLPTFVIINNYKVSMSDFLYLMSQATIQLENGNQAKISHKTIAPATNSNGDNNTGNLDKAAYLDLAQRLVNFMDQNKQAPSFATVTEGKIKYEALVCIYSRILNFYKDNKQMPNFVRLENTHLVKAAAVEPPAQPPAQPPVQPPVNNTPLKLSNAAITEAANRINAFIAANQRLPLHVTINNVQVPIS
ncbi:MAG: hypothetical protein KMY52_07160, partial [Methanobacterium sp.]|nr:hypothetical protein [Methanobacterium sp.]